jgi:hypothetical protein
MSTIPSTAGPRFGSIPRAIDYSGRSRSRLYQLAAKHPGLFRKDGKSSLVDFAILDRILDGFPIGPQADEQPRRRRLRTASTDIA